MQNPFLKEELSKAKKESVKTYRSPKALLGEIAGEHRRVKRGESALGKNSCRWLSDNYYLIERAATKLSRAKYKKYNAIRPVTDAFVEAVDIPDKENVSALFEALTRDGYADDSMIEGVKCALLCSCLEKICKRINESGELGTKIELLRRLESFDFTPYVTGFSESERYLRSDPQGVWQRMRGESRELYKRKILKMAKARRIPFEAMCRKISEKACENSRHIGEYIEFDNSSAYFYYPATAIIFTLMLFVIGAVLVGISPFLKAVLLVCLAFPVFETSVRLASFLVSLFYKSEVLPRVEIDSVDTDTATLLVIPAMVPDKDEAERLFSHLEKLYLKSKSRKGEDKALFFGIMADFPERSERVSAKETEIVNLSQNRVRLLNEAHGEHFVFFTREKVWDETERVFKAHERKRGALLELVRFVLKKTSPVKSYGASLPKIKYVVTLDSDTDIGMGDLSKLIGTMEHPLNTPKVGEKNGVFYVKKGFGILQPDISVSLESAFATPFSLLISGAGGHDSYHGPIFNLFHVLHRRSMFCGKGIFDAECYLKVLENAFPDGVVLSHDMLEGSRLRAGFIPDLSFSDSVPKNVISYFKRACRWARGDVQALGFVSRRVPDRRGNTVQNPQPLSDRFVFYSNVVNLLSPVFSCLAMFIAATLPATLSGYVFLAAASPLWLWSVLQFAGMTLRLSFTGFFRRFFTEAVTGIRRELIHFFYSLSSLFLRAWKNYTSILISLWRVCVSGRRLLEWSTASQAEKSSEKAGGIAGYFLYTLPSFLAGIYLLVFSVNGWTRLAGVLWCSLFFVGYITSIEKRQAKKLPSSVAKKLKFYAEKSWGYFEKCVDRENNYLPCDNISVIPGEFTAHRTSPTNIGMYLLSALAAADMGFISEKELYDRLDKTVMTLEKLPKYKGHLYNWYDTKTLEILGEEYISTVDSGNLVVCLLTLRMGLGEYFSRVPGLEQISCRLSALEKGMDFRFLYDSSRGLFFIGYNTSREENDSGHYDLYMSEARTTDYYAVASGIVEKEHWSRLSKALVAKHRLIGSASWSGTAFEYFMPHLFLPIYKNSFIDEALSFAFSEQVYHSSKTSSTSVWGTSESGYFAFDRDMNYQYRAFGVPSLALSRDSEKERVISPYSTFLMLSQNPELCLKNLERLEKIGMWGEFGFYEAIDFTSSRVGGGCAMVKSYMAHHVGMSIVSVANTLYGGIFRKRFMRDAQMGSASELLKEKIPVDAVIVRRSSKKQRITRPSSVLSQDTQTVCKSSSRYAAASLCGRDSSLVLCQDGVMQFVSKGISLIRPDTPLAFLPFCRNSKREFSPLTSDGKTFIYGRGFARYTGEGADIILNLSADAAAVRVRISSDSEEKGIYLEPSGVSRASFISHPAYSELFFESDIDKDSRALFLEYKGKEPLCQCLLCDREYEFELFREKIFACRDRNASTLFDYLKRTPSLSCKTGTLLSGCILARSRDKGDCVFVIGYGKSRAEAFRAASSELQKTHHKSISDSDAFEKRMLASAHSSGFDTLLCEKILSCFDVRDRFILCSSLPHTYSINELWKYGISGDHPVVCVRAGLREEFLRNVLTLHRYHYITGVKYDLVFLCSDSGYLTPEMDGVSSLLDSCACRFMENQKGGVFLLGRECEEMLRAASAVFIESEDIKEMPPLPWRKSADATLPYGDGNGENGFCNDGYTVNKKVYNPEILWHHIIASDSFGTLVSTRGLGHTWVYNAGLYRFGVWENDRVSSERGEKLYLTWRGGCYDVCRVSHTVEFTPGRAVYTSPLCRVSVFCHPKLLYKRVEVELFVPGEVTLLYKISPVMGDGTMRAGGVFGVDIGTGMKFSHPFSNVKNSGFGYLICENADEIHSSAFGVECRKEEAEGERVVFTLGFAGSEKHFEKVISTDCDTEALSIDFARKFLPPPKKTLFSENAERMYNVHLPLQCAVSRILARTGPYQSGGAWGGRDQTQDMLFMVDICPDRVFAHLCRVASHQFEKGDIQHWWHGFRGTRTECSDDYLWFVLLLSVYFEKTGDDRIFQKEITYLSSPPLAKNESERYFKAEKGRVRESLVLHAKRCIDLFFERGYGEHGIPFMGSGDWNDGMNAVGNGGGESVWLGFFALSVIYKSFPLFERVIPDVEYMKKECRKIYESLEKNAYFTDRYARAFLSDGTPIGVREFESGCKIDSISASAASICYAVTGLGRPDRISAFLDSCWRELYDEKKGIYKLFSPPFTSFDSRIGYVTNYPEGVRENGGQYTHAAVFAALGYLFAPSEKKKNLSRAKAILDCILSCDKDLSVFKTEPWVLAADIYSNPTHPGRGGWSFYTGSAGWCRFLMSKIQEKSEKSE